LLKEELCTLYSSPNIIRIIKSRRVGCAGHVAGMQMKRSASRVLVGKPEKDQWEDLEINKMVALKCILRT
jgi:hypothetical protein